MSLSTSDLKKILPAMRSSTDFRWFRLNGGRGIRRSFYFDITIPITLYNKSGKNLDIQTDRVMNGLEGSRMAFMESGVKLLSINDAGQGTNVYGETTVHYRAINVNVVSLV